jgi:predicted nucleic acid-binding protein
MDDIEFLDPEVFRDAMELAEHTDLDLSDAFQLLSLQAGYFRYLAGDSKTLLVTADAALAQAARQRALPVRDCMREPMPQS